MYLEHANFNGLKVLVVSLNTVVVGTGAAAYNAADRLHSYGQKDIAIVTEGIKAGTSRNTGSDKQTYYKLTLSGNSDDSVYEMAETLFNGGSMHGDIALVEAALSAKCFYHLVDIGVPFPHNKYGEYIGYKTDHDPRQRATSAGPLTSKYMTEKLEHQVMNNNIHIFDGYMIIGILANKEKTEALGLIALNMNNLKEKDERYVIFNCTNIIYGVGAPAGMYKSSVYPESQSGASGIAFEAGVKGKNLTEFQYGIASIKFRWNLSGTYQQVLPRYISTDAEGGDEREFLNEYFNDFGKMLDCVFLKGYQWPFDPKKVNNYGSSIIDLLVYNETTVKGRRVFLDFTRNPSEKKGKGDDLDFSILCKETYDYLNNSDALFGRPIDRLSHMNQPAIDLYKEHGIDLTKEYLEIAVCAQHNNGGLYGNIWWESNLKHLFPVGEVNGSHGVYRPGGSALNSGQVGSTRAAQFITARYKEAPMENKHFLSEISEQAIRKIELGEVFAENITCNTTGNIAGNNKLKVFEVRNTIGEIMSSFGGHVRSVNGIRKAIKEILELLGEVNQIKLDSINELPFAYKDYDLLMSAYVYLNAMKNYIENGGGSRGSYMILSGEESLSLSPASIGNINVNIDVSGLMSKIQTVLYNNGSCSFEWEDVRPVPCGDNWFENVWNAYMRDEIVQ